MGYTLFKLQYIFYDAEEGREGDWIAEKNDVLFKFGILILFIVVIYALNKSLFGFMGEKLTCTIRIELFSETMHKQISWFDRQDRAPGILTSVFSENIEAVRGMTSEAIVTYAEAIFAYCIGTISGLILCPP